eukprot:Pgem_evm1s781
MFFLDESPRWLVQKGRFEEARSCLLRIRQEYEVDAEMSEIISNIDEQKEQGEGSWAEVFSNKDNMLYRLFVGCGGQFLQQVCGINAIMFFAPSIINTFFGEQESIYVGRVSLLFSGAIGMTIGTVIVCILSSPALDYKNDMTTGVFIIVFCAIYVVFFAYSWGPVIWVVCAEIYPQRLRGKAMSLSTATNWGMATIIGKVTPLMLREENFDMWGTFLFFGAWCVICSLWSYTCVPETANVPLENMGQLFNDFKPGFQNPTKKLKTNKPD